MSWIILTHPPGGTTGKVCKRYAVVKKLCLLEEAYRLRQESNLSLCGAAGELGVHHSLLVKWTKDLACLQSTLVEEAVHLQWTQWAAPSY
jgi:hypothetical protein